MILFFIATLSAVSFAQQTRLTSTSGGYDLVKPTGWGSEENSEGFALANPAKTIVVAVKSHNYKDFAAFGADANLERDGLTLIGQPSEINGGVFFRTAKAVNGGALVFDTFVLFSPHGGGVVIVAITDEPNSQTAKDTAATMAASVRFTKVQPTAVSGQIRNALSGKHLLYLYTASGYSERKDIVLCSSGTFYHSTDLGGFSPNNANGGSFGSASTKSGNWSISPDGKALVLAFANGATTRYTLSARQASNEIGMNGMRFFIQTQNRC